MKTVIDILNAEIKKSYKYLEKMDEPSQEQTPEFEDGYKSGLEQARHMIQNADTGKIIKAAIGRFVKDNYGQSELRNPSWNIQELANAIDTSIKGA